MDTTSFGNIGTGRTRKRRRRDRNGLQSSKIPFSMVRRPYPSVCVCVVFGLLRWTDILLLIALLLIPDMGRSKYFMHQSLHGRNMIISMYVWMAYCRSLPPGTTPNPANKRDRKAISSHIQVLKNFFKDHRFCMITRPYCPPLPEMHPLTVPFVYLLVHFFFPTKDEEQRRSAKDDGKSVESHSLKTNPVLMALSRGRFPDVRPNYEYFAHLLSQNSTVSARPKTCWVFVSSPHIQIQEDGAVTGRDGKALDVTKFPQLAVAMEEGETPYRGPDGSVILHEYTSTLSQTYSGPAKEVTKHWETNFPALHDCLNLPEPQDEDALTILEMTVTLSLHQNAFPTGSELNGLIEMTIEQPFLQNHQWKCVTRLVRPRELCTEDEPLFLEHTDEMAVQYTHQPGCGDNKTGCDCISRPRQDVRVPFPAAEWASMLTNCVSYPNVVPEERLKGRGQSGGDEEEYEKTGSEPSQRELLSRIGMFQELWSCGPTLPHGGGGGMEGGWARRAVILWKFRDVHQYNARKKKWVAAESPTAQWRFLTVNDPTSEYHMNNAYISYDEALAAGAEFLSPQDLVQEQGPDHRGFSQEDFMAWNMDASVANHLRGLDASVTDFPVMGLVDGLATPPTLPSSFSTEFPSPHDMGRNQFGLMHSECGTPMESQPSSLFGDAAAPVTPGNNPFLAENMTMAAAAGIVYDDVVCDPALQAWNTASSLPELKPWLAGTDPRFDPSSLTPSDKTPEWPADHGIGQVLWDAAGTGCLQMPLQPEWNDMGKNERMDVQTTSGAPTLVGTPPPTATFYHELGLAGKRIVKRARTEGLELETNFPYKTIDRFDGPVKRVRRDMRRVASRA